MSKRVILGTCSQCRRKKTFVLRAKGVQLYQYCIDKLEVPSNTQAFRRDTK